MQEHDNITQLKKKTIIGKELEFTEELHITPKDIPKVYDYLLNDGNNNKNITILEERKPYQIILLYKKLFGLKMLNIFTITNKKKMITLTMRCKVLNWFNRFHFTYAGSEHIETILKKEAEKINKQFGKSS